MGEAKQTKHTTSPGMTNLAAILEVAFAFIMTNSSLFLPEIVV
jgi:hypothetical protein